MLFEQLAQFSSACSNVNRSEAVAPHGGKKHRSPPVFSRIDFIQSDQSLDWAVELTC